MKKLFLGLALAAFTLSIYSCRETTEENTDTTIEEVEADVESDFEEAEAEIEETTEEVEAEIETEVEDNDGI